MVLSIFGLSQDNDNNKVKIDASNNTIKFDQSNNTNNKIRIGGQDAALDTRESLSTAVRDQRAFSVASGMVDIPTGMVLNIRFSNPSDSGKNAMFVARKMEANRGPSEPKMRYNFHINPAGAGSTTLTASNRFTGGPASSMVCTCGIEDTKLDGSPASIQVQGGRIPQEGVLREIDDGNADVSRVVPPGSGFGFTIGAPQMAGTFTEFGAARFIFTWYEEDV